MTRGILAVAVGASLALSFPRVVVLEEGFLPENSMRIPVNALEGGINQAQFNEVMDRIEEIYGPEIAARGGQLVVRRLWDNETVNASAQRWGDMYILNMYGGLARHPSITQDGMALVACHEMGHHIGGAPKYDGGLDWASNEGQSDYFANLKCLRRIFASPASAAFTRRKGDESQPRKACAEAFESEADRALCVRGAMAGMSVTGLLSALRGETTLPRFDTPDPVVVSRTIDWHPDSQCRLDTYFAGSVCSRAVADEVSETDPEQGVCTAASGHSAGLRPLCWYKPYVPGQEPPAEPEPSPEPEALAVLKNPDLWK